MQVKQLLQQILKCYMASCVPVQLPSEISPTKECRHHFEGFSEIWGFQRFVINMERDGGQIRVVKAKRLLRGKRLKG